MEQITLFWLNGKLEVLNGEDLLTSIRNVGYNPSVLKSLDFWVEGNKELEYYWCEKTKIWKSEELRNL